MLEHTGGPPRPPERVVVMGAGGFVGRAIVNRLGGDGVACLPLTRRDVDLLGDGAARTLAALLRPTDSVVMVSAIAPARTAGALVQNVRMAEAVCEALAAVPPAHAVYVSSDAVYADDADPVTEDSCRQPSSFHGLMHATRELMFETTVKAPLTVLRPSLLYGPGDPHNGYGPNRFRRLAAKGQPIVLFGDGEERRDHVFIDDVGAIASRVLAHRSRGVLNVATGVSVSFREVAQMTAARTAAEVKGSPRQNPIGHRHFDVTACLKAFPTFRYTTLADGLARSSAEA
jgi:UDP-glucose 4-epimerase